MNATIVNATEYREIPHSLLNESNANLVALLTRRARKSQCKIISNTKSVFRYPRLGKEKGNQRLGQRPSLLIADPSSPGCIYDKVFEDYLIHFHQD
jgi:hypothetical protein